MLEPGLGGGAGGVVVVIVGQVGIVHSLARPNLPVLHTGQTGLATNFCRGRGGLHYTASLGRRIGGERELLTLSASSWLGSWSGGREGGIFEEKFYSEEACHLEQILQSQKTREREHRQSHKNSIYISLPF